MIPEIDRKVPIIEVFGPTVQGEGNMIGRVTMFIRVGACDYKCYHCDSMHAVDKHQIQLRAKYLLPGEVVEYVKRTDTTGMCPWVTISGGNPALWEMGDIVRALQNAGYKVAVETQGSYWKDWLTECDLVTVSPKGPSMWKNVDFRLLKVFREKLFVPSAEKHIRASTCLKVVVFNDEDIKFAEKIVEAFPGESLYLSIGNQWEPKFDPDTGEQNGYPASKLRNDLAIKYDQIATKIYSNKLLKDATLLPQLHVLIWGNEGSR